VTSWERDTRALASGGVNVTRTGEVKETMDRHGLDTSSLTDPLGSLACGSSEDYSIAMMGQPLTDLFDDGCLTSPCWASHARELG
jgi:hypothetical protein